MAGSRPGRVSWDTVRIAVRREAARTSMRAVAREIGIGPAALIHMMNGGTPYTRNGELLEKWFLALPEERRGAGFEIEERMMEKQLEGLEGQARDETFRIILDAIVQGHRKQGTRPPEWVHWMRKRGPSPPLPPDTEEPSDGGEPKRNGTDA